jgi:hypothetical protein
MAAVLAGLRLYQRHLEVAGVPGDIWNTATNCERFSSLEMEEIDALCERINLQEDEPKPRTLVDLPRRGEGCTGEDAGCSGDGLFLCDDCDGQRPPDGKIFVQRCDYCEEFPDDQAAAVAYGTPFYTDADGNIVATLKG